MSALLLLLAAAGAFAEDPAREAYRRLHSAPFALESRPAPDARELELGRKLFFDPRLSARGTMSCASCHDPSRAWGDGLARARGAGQKELARNTPSLLAARRGVNKTFFWDGRAPTMEDAILTALQNRVEMARDPATVESVLRSIPEYARAFEELYGRKGLNAANLARALAQFVRHEIRPGESPFERFARDDGALDARAKRGLALFAGKARCALCHSGPELSHDAFHNIGLAPRAGAEDLGRGSYVADPRARRAFRTPSLRDVARTAPYMHDGSLRDLRAVIEFYNRGGDVAEGRDELIVPLNLSEEEKDALAAFLESLTRPEPEFEIPALPPAAPLSTALRDAPAPAPLAAEAERLLAEFELASSTRPDAAAALLADFSVPGLIEDLARSRWGARTSRMIEQDAAVRLRRWFEYKALLERDPAVCDALKGAKTYFGIERPGAAACRELYLENRLSLALMSRADDLPLRCRESLEASYPDIGAAHRDEACRVIAAAPDPRKTCAGLIPRLLGEEKREACEMFFARLRAAEDPESCDPLMSGPPQWMRRCRALSSFARARRTGSPEACLGDGLCLSLLGRRESLAKAESDIKERVERILRRNWRLELPGALERARAGLREAEGALESREAARAPADRAAALSLDEDAERLARLEERARRLELLAPSWQLVDDPADDRPKTGD